MAARDPARHAAGRHEPLRELVDAAESFVGRRSQASLCQPYGPSRVAARSSTAGSARAWSGRQGRLRRDQKVVGARARGGGWVGAGPDPLARCSTRGGAPIRLATTEPVCRIQATPVRARVSPIGPGEPSRRSVNLVTPGEEIGNATQRVNLRRYLSIARRGQPHLAASVAGSGSMGR
jgi:hypothetical protein